MRRRAEVIAIYLIGVAVFAAVAAVAIVLMRDQGSREDRVMLFSLIIVMGVLGWPVNVAVGALVLVAMGLARVILGVVRRMG
jgi:hypothetical protein